MISQIVSVIISCCGFHSLQSKIWCRMPHSLQQLKSKLVIGMAKSHQYLHVTTWAQSKHQNILDPLSLTSWDLTQKASASFTFVITHLILTGLTLLGGEDLVGLSLAMDVRSLAFSNSLSSSSSLYEFSSTSFSRRDARDSWSRSSLPSKDRRDRWRSAYFMLDREHMHSCRNFTQREAGYGTGVLCKLMQWLVPFMTSLCSTRCLLQHVRTCSWAMRYQSQHMKVTHN